MRLFTALDLPPEILGIFERLLPQLGQQTGLRWSPQANLHITLKFIGPWPEEHLDQLQAALETVSSAAPLSLELQGLGWFPNRHAPRTLWAGIRGGEAIHVLAAAIENALLPLGVLPEEKAFLPHITLARMTSPVPLGLHAKVEELEPLLTGRFSAASFHLYSSISNSDSTTVYQKLRTFPLK